MDGENTVQWRKLVNGLLGAYLVYVGFVFLAPRVVQYLLPWEEQIYAARTVRDLEEAWYERLPQDEHESLLTLLVKTSGPLKSAEGLPMKKGAPYAELPKHPCARFAGWAYYDDNRTVAGLFRKPEETGNTVLCIDFNSAKAPNKIGTDIFYANFNPTGDFDTRASDPTFVAGAEPFRFHWGDRTHGIFNRQGHALPGVTVDNGPLGTILFRR